MFDIFVWDYKTALSHVDEIAQVLLKAFPAQAEQLKGNKDEVFQGCCGFFDPELCFWPVAFEKGSKNRQNPQIIGLALFFVGSPRAVTLANLAVDPQFRGRGLGHMLMRVVQMESVKRNILKMTGTVDLREPTAKQLVQLYSHLGAIEDRSSSGGNTEPISMKLDRSYLADDPIAVLQSFLQVEDLDRLQEFIDKAEYLNVARHPWRPFSWRSRFGKGAIVLALFGVVTAFTLMKNSN